LDDWAAERSDASRLKTIKIAMVVAAMVIIGGIIALLVIDLRPTENDIEKPMIEVFNRMPNDKTL
jgi:hypothetical protein